MPDFLVRKRSPLFAIVVAALVAACAAPVPPVEPDDPVRPACTPVAAADPLQGNWLFIRSQKGVAGELRTLFALQTDGTMAYTEQLKRPGQPSQGLSETGCWSHDGQVLVMRTYESNGSLVDLDDPIYVNRYQVMSVDQDRLRLTTSEGAAITARKMSPGYRLPF